MINNQIKIRRQKIERIELNIPQDIKITTKKSDGRYYWLDFTKKPKALQLEELEILNIEHPEIVKAK